MGSLVTRRVQLHHPKPRWRVSGFLDVTDLFWDSCEAQVQPGEMDTRNADEVLSHEPLVFVSGASEGFEQR